MDNQENIQPPIVTVLMPVYNGGIFLAEAIKSVLIQTYHNFEFLIIDDGSTDDSLNVINSFEDPRIKLVVNNANLRLIATLNKGLSLARGKYVVRMDADDICHPDRLLYQVEYMENHPEVGICGSFVAFIGQEQRILRLPIDHENIYARLLFKPPIIHPSVILNMNLINSHQLRYNPEYIHAEDFGLWMDAAPLMKIANISRILLKYRLSEQNISKIALLDIEKNDAILNKIYAKQLNRANIPFTKDELYIHALAASNFKVINSFEELSRISKWLMKLYELNKRNGIYSRAGMQYALATTLFSVLKRTKVPIWKKLRFLNLSFFSWWSVKNIMIEKGL